eukprot:GFUD01056252.1.p1 GENE.GFUD01056252.1~~GFUD01056252.1.p1  ORF type:complete len:288 (+),score=21.54 GFUD01056252.1:2-865(+)
MKVLILLFCQTVLVVCQYKQREACLLEGQVFYKQSGESGECRNLLERGPCGRGHQLVLGEGYEGVCRKIPSCEGEEVKIVNIKHGAVCSCILGKVGIHGKCQTIFSNGLCASGEILLPANYGLSDGECPAEFSCKSTDTCDSFAKAKKELLEISEDLKLSSHIQSLYCDTNESMICCPNGPNASKSLISPEMIVNSFKVSSKTQCLPNPCNPGVSWPWMQEGKSTCVKMSAEVRYCSGVVIKNGTTLECHDDPSEEDDFFALAPITNQKCGRRKIWSPYHQRCVRIF